MQIAVRLPDELVAYVDSLVSGGAAGSRASVVAQALRLYRQQLSAEADARLLEEKGDYEDFDGLVAHASLGD